MANRVQRPASPQTTIKNFIEYATKALRAERPKERKLTRYDHKVRVSYPANPEKDFDVIIELWPASRFSDVGVAVVYHPEHGKYKARMNGLCQWNAGKPNREFSVDEIKQMVARGAAAPLWPHLGY
jgi:hypothetical protein